MSKTGKPNPETTLPDAIEDTGLFLGADGVNASAAWILKDHGKAGVFTDAAIDQIIEACRPTFTLTVEDLRKLSKSLGSALNPEDSPFLYGASRSSARKRGLQGLDRVTKHIEKGAAETIAATSAIEKLEQTSFTEAGPLNLSGIRCKIVAAQALLMDAAQALNAVTDDISVYTPRFNNRRHVPDIRRRHVVLIAHQFLQQTGNPSGFTTDINTYERSGGLMEFLDVIVPQITNPPGKLSRDTVAKDIQSMRKLKQDLSIDED